MSESLSPCPNKEVCGSCGWSHIPYTKQLEQKRSDINGSFALKGIEDIRCEEILPSPQTEHYRNRMDFVIDFEKRVGLRQKGKWWRVIDDHYCFIADERIEGLARDVRSWVQDTPLAAFDRKAHHGLLRYAVIRSTTLGETMVILVTSVPTNDEELTLVRSELAKLDELLDCTTLIWSQVSSISDVSIGDIVETVTGPGVVMEEIEGVRFRISPNAFFQTNPHGAAELLKTVLEFSGDVSGKTVLDLYCGSGFFGIAMSKKLLPKQLIGAEIVEEAIVDAKENARLNAVEDSTTWYAAKTEEFDWQQFNADLVILDPPRSGMHDAALADLLAAAPQEIVYVSCNYKQFARELVQLRELYIVESMRAVDMFPHTPHVELVTKLRKKS